MKSLRAIALGLLIVALLPWGAFLSARAQLPQERQSVQLPVTAPPAGRPCRTALLPGQGCGHDLAVLPDLSLLPPPVQPGILRFAAVPLPQGAEPATVRRPPRRAA